MNNDDDTKLNTQDAFVEETQEDVSPVDITPVGSDELTTEDADLTPELEEKVEEALDEQLSEEMEDSSTVEPSEKDEEAEEEVQDAVDEENEQTTEDVAAVDETEDADAPKVNEDGTPATEFNNPNARWYVVHTYSGHENRVATNLRQRIETEGLENKIIDILVPTQDKIEIRGGKKEQVKEKVFPGYILVKMELDNLAWIAVRTTQGVIGFVGAGTKPMPISEAEVKSIVQFMNQGAAPTFKEVFMVDDTVKIIDGPFADFIGKVESVDKEKGKLRILVSIFGRETPVELDFLQVSKL